MKKNIFLYTTLILLLFAGCSKMKDRMFDDMLLSYDVSSYLSHQINIRVVNANMESATFPNARLSISGRNANEVYDINGGKEIVMTDGNGDMVIAPGKDITAPMVFDVTATADGFIPLTKTITIQPKDSFTVHTLMMLELNHLPAGIDVENTNIDVQKLSSAPIGINSSTFDGEVSQNVNLNLPVGSVLYDENRIPITDPVSLELINYNGSNSKIRTLLPPMIHCTSNHLIKNGIEDEEISFIPINMIDLKINSGNKSISSSSKAIQTRIELDPNTYNAMTSQNLKNGDIISIYYRKDVNENWSFVKDATITQNINGKYYVNLDVFKPGQYVSMAKSGGTSTTTCTNTLVITFTRPNAVNTFHDIEIREATTNKVIFDYPEVAVCNLCTFTVPNKLPAGKTISIVVYEYDYSDYKGRPVKNVTQLPACPSAVTIPVDPLAINGNPLMRFSLITYCPNEPSTIAYYHDGRINYRFYLTGRWVNLGLAKKGVMETDRLRFDNRYEFQTKVSIVPKGSKKAVTKPYTRDRWTWKDPVLFGEPAAYGKFVLVTGTTNTWRFDRDSWIAPITACQDFGYSPNQ